jgi:hypothetical protein
MVRRINNPSLPAELKILPISLGGTNASTPLQASVNLGLLRNNQVMVANGALTLNSDGKIAAIHTVDALALRQISIQGEFFLTPAQETIYTITDFDIFKIYNIQFSSGTWTVEKDKIYYKAPTSLGQQTLTVNDRVLNITVQAAGPSKPAIYQPYNNSFIIDSSYTIKSTAFKSVGSTDSHISTDWQVATDSGFENIIASGTEDVINLVTFPLQGLTNTLHYARVRYRSSSGAYTQWSDPVTFTPSMPVYVPEEEPFSPEEEPETPTEDEVITDPGIDTPPDPQDEDPEEWYEEWYEEYYEWPEEPIFDPDEWYDELPPYDEFPQYDDDGTSPYDPDEWNDDPYEWYDELPPYDDFPQYDDDYPIDDGDDGEYDEW